MDKTLDFVARVGDVGLGLIFLLFGIGLILVIIIEIVDFLFVDPIVRRQAESTVTELEQKEEN